MAARRQDDKLAKRILDAAIALARRDGFQWLTRAEVAERAGVSPSLVSYHCGSMIELKRQVLTTAVERKILPIVAQGLADKHPITAAAPDALKTAALATL